MSTSSTSNTKSTKSPNPIKNLSNFSEVAPLLEVLTHRPGKEVDNMPPTMMEDLLFDDILFGREARKEHDIFTSVLRAYGAKVWDSETLLEETLVSAYDQRQEIIGFLQYAEGISSELAKRMMDFSPEILSDALIRGIAVPETEMTKERFFELNPASNLLMSRDAQIVLGDGIVIAAMARAARVRETCLSRFIFTHHPEFQGTKILVDYSPGGDGGQPKCVRRGGAPTLEGGDVIILREGVLLVGVSERTMELGLDTLVEVLRKTGSFDTLVMVSMPPNRSQMHLDTVLTRISREELLVFPPMFDPKYCDTLSVTVVSLSAGADAGRRYRSLGEALEALSLDLEMIPCGGHDDFLMQSREQWTDGANSFALDNGLIVLYDRNTATIEQLDCHGFEQLTPDAFIADAEAIKASNRGGSKYVITLPSSELSRARGGPHCMTMPLLRG